MRGFQIFRGLLKWGIAPPPPPFALRGGTRRRKANSWTFRTYLMALHTLFVAVTLCPELNEWPHW